MVVDSGRTLDDAQSNSILLRRRRRQRRHVVDPWTLDLDLLDVDSDLRRTHISDVKLAYIIVRSKA